ncbi:MAG: hypothetical protein WB696_15645 [Chthoniobacterales bacterium]
MISIRRMTAVDVPVSQVLLSQLGYQTDVQEVRRRYDAVVQSGDHALMVAEQGVRERPIYSARRSISQAEAAGG